MAQTMVNPDLRRLREVLKLSQRELAMKMGASRDSVCRWEKGEPMSMIARTALAVFVDKPEVREPLMAAMSAEEASTFGDGLPTFSRPDPAILASLWQLLQSRRQLSLA